MSIQKASWYLFVLCAYIHANMGLLASWKHKLARSKSHMTGLYHGWFVTGLAVPLWERWIWMKTGVLQIRLLIQIKLFNSISTVPRVQHLISSHLDILSNYCPSCRPFSQVWSSLSLWHLFLPRCSLSPKRSPNPAANACTGETPNQVLT